MTEINQLKAKILRTAHRAKEGHVASAFSVLDIIYVLYHEVLTYDANNPRFNGRDYFFLSKGHASLALYAVLERAGLIDGTWEHTYCQMDSEFGGHPHRIKVNGAEASTGSLGHGFPMAIGVAMALKATSVGNGVFCVIGDGEANEGTVWESALLAGHHHLNNLVLYVDFNHSNDRAVIVDPLVAKFKAFGWDAFEIDGHCHTAILNTQESLHNVNYKPTAYICHTIKGKGIRDMEQNPHAWHHRSPTDAELESFLKELEA